MAEVKCAICADVVSKRKTLEVPGVGRVCRKHSEAQEAKDAKEADRKAAEVKAAESSVLDGERPSPMCFGCGMKGFTKQQAAAAMFVEMELAVPVEGQDFFDMMRETSERAKKQLNGEALIIVPLDGNREKLLRATRKNRNEADFLGVTCLCRSCAESGGVDFDAAFMPKATTLGGRGAMAVLGSLCDGGSN